VKYSDFQRGVIAAAGIAAMYNSTSTHRYRLDACIRGKLNVDRVKPRLNRQTRSIDRDPWLVGASTALAEMHRRLLHGNDSTSVCAVARTIGLTIKSARAAGVAPYDLRELKKAGVP
jgi:hypothetical protein